MKSSSKDCGLEGRTRSSKRRQASPAAEVEEARKRQKKRLEKEFLRVKVVIGPQDIVTDPVLPKLKVAAEEDVKVQREPVDIHEIVAVEEVVTDAAECEEAPEEPVPSCSSGASTDEVTLLKAQIQELKAKVASLEVEVEKHLTKEQTDGVVGFCVNSWNPVTKHLNLTVLSREPSSEKLEISTVTVVKEPSSEIFGIPHPFQDHLVRVEGNVDSYIEACLSSCKNLEHITLPKIEYQNGKFEKVLESLRKKVVARNSCVREINFENVINYLNGFIPYSNESSRVDQAFLYFIRACAKHGVRICNPCTTWSLSHWDMADKQRLGKCLKSLVLKPNSRSSFFGELPLERLETLNINGTGEWVKDLQPKLEWTANLKHLRVETWNKEEASVILAPTSLRHLHLRKLVLKVRVEWSSLENMWLVLPSLEELELNRFPIPTGDVEENQMFLQLKYLRKVCLKNIHGIVDPKHKFVCNVLSQMQLTHLDISCPRPNTDPHRNLILWEGIEGLMKGPCGQSIQELTVDAWTLPNRIPFSVTGEKKEMIKIESLEDLDDD